MLWLQVISNHVAPKEEGAKEAGAGPSGSNELRHFVRRYKEGLIRTDLPLRIMTLTDSQALYPDVKHIWIQSLTILINFIGIS